MYGIVSFCTTEDFLEGCLSKFGQTISFVWNIGLALNKSWYTTGNVSLFDKILILLIDL